MQLRPLLDVAAERRASDLHLTVGRPPTLRIAGTLYPMDMPELRPADTAAISEQVLTPQRKQALAERGEIDLSYSVPGLGRYRVNIYQQRGSTGVAMRLIPESIPSFDDLGLPQVVRGLSDKYDGLIIVTGPTGSGKSTTLAAVVDRINSTRCCHILTLEDPIEYLHRHKLSMVNQREVFVDTQSFVTGLRSALREDPDVIMVGEMRDLDTIATAISAAETGHLVLATLHTPSAAQTIDRIVDVFPLTSSSRSASSYPWCCRLSWRKSCCPAWTAPAWSWRPRC
jgi:twitching motility protein PilT